MLANHVHRHSTSFSLLSAQTRSQLQRLNWAPRIFPNRASRNSNQTLPSCTVHYTITASMHAVPADSALVAEGVPSGFLEEIHSQVPPPSTPHFQIADLKRHQGKIHAR